MSDERVVLWSRCLWFCPSRERGRTNPRSRCGEIVDFSWENIDTNNGIRGTIESWPTLQQLLALKNGATQTLAFRVAYDPALYQAAKGAIQTDSFQPVPCTLTECAMELNAVCFLLGATGFNPWDPMTFGPSHCQLTMNISQDQTRCSCRCDEGASGWARGGV